MVGHVRLKVNDCEYKEYDEVENKKQSTDNLTNLVLI